MIIKPNKSVAITNIFSLDMDTLKSEINPIIVVKTKYGDAGYIIHLFDYDYETRIGRSSVSFLPVCEVSDREMLRLSFPNGFNHMGVVYVGETHSGHSIYKSFLHCDDADRFDDVIGNVVPDMDGFIMQETWFRATLLREMDVPWSAHVSFENNHPVVSLVFENERTAMEYKLNL